MVSVAGNPCKKCRTRVVNLDQHVGERCPVRPDGGVHMLTRPSDPNDLYMAKIERETTKAASTYK